MSERLSSSSSDLQKVPRVDSVVRLCADQLDYLGQRRVATTLREIEKQITAKLEAAKYSAADIDVRPQKVAWIQELEKLKPEWLIFFRR